MKNVVTCISVILLISCNGGKAKKGIEKFYSRDFDISSTSTDGLKFIAAEYQTSDSKRAEELSRMILEKNGIYSLENPSLDKSLNDYKNAVLRTLAAHSELELYTYVDNILATSNTAVYSNYSPTKIIEDIVHISPLLL